jgi:hypothetical protein
MATAEGREVLKRRRAKGRNRLTVTSNNHVKKVRWSLPSRSDPPGLARLAGQVCQALTRSINSNVRKRAPATFVV